jgi:hypothetical protein
MTSETKLKLIKLANDEWKRNGSDFDEDAPIQNVEEAITFFVMSSLSGDENISSEEIYDYLTEKSN